jgi:hypothetical protein
MKIHCRLTFVLMGSDLVFISVFNRLSPIECFFLVHGMIGMGKTALYFEDILFLAILNAMEGGEDDMTAKIITHRTGGLEGLLTC